jgi:hypothetical protein
MEIIIEYKSNLILNGTLHEFQSLTYFSKCFESRYEIRDREEMLSGHNAKLSLHGTLHKVHPLTLSSEVHLFSEDSVPRGHTWYLSY